MATSSHAPAEERPEAAAAAAPFSPPAGVEKAGAMELPGVLAGAVEDGAGVWDWGNLLDFSIEVDDPLVISWEEDRPAPPLQATSVSIPPPPPPEESSPGPSIQASTSAAAAGRVRKRDPRLVCENFLAGRIPCSCPEEDEKDEVEEEAVGAVAGGGRKRVRAGGAAAITRCQVPGCEADIRELKGYHRRHRVCLRCANATSVFLDGETKRYCQQCGKFHVLPDFDEGKRSCRRKLERHNKRRRRRLVDHKNVLENGKESLGNLPTDVEGDEEPKDNSELSNGAATGLDSTFGNKSIDTETSLEPEDEQGSPVPSVPSFHTLQSNSMLSFAASGETKMEERIDNNKSTISSSFCGNKDAYSSMCPTGRVSFKLYDWNPADFPRRLRHQIFQWLASMPVELEGYIRPGCTILTIFIAMPQSIWDKLSKDSAVYVNNLVKGPQGFFSGRGNMLVYLNNQIFQVTKDGILLANIKMEVHVPRLHYVHPNCFEAGKPVEFIACGSNLLRHKFRFLVSCSGKYLHNEFVGVVSHGVIKSCNEVGDEIYSSDHQILLIRIHNTEPDMFGPAFVEVENECGISNFIPVLFGDQNVCTEMMTLQGSPSENLYTDTVHTAGTDVSCPCDRFVTSQTSTSDLLLDIAWFLKAPTVNVNEMISSSIFIQRFTCLLRYLVWKESFSILEKLLMYLDRFVAAKDLKELMCTLSDSEVAFFLACIKDSRNVLYQKRKLNEKVQIDSEDSNGIGFCGLDGDLRLKETHALVSVNQNRETESTAIRQSLKDQASKGNEEAMPLLDKDTVRCAACYPHSASKWQQGSWLHMFSGRTMGTRLAVLLMVTVVMCCGICFALLHPHKAGDFVVTVRRCLFGGPDYRPQAL